MVRIAAYSPTAGVHDCRNRWQEAQVMCYLQLYGRKRAFLAATGQWPERLQGKNQWSRCIRFRRYRRGYGKRERKAFDHGAEELAPAGDPERYGSGKSCGVQAILE